jgi:hypothetical protein
MYLFYFFSRKTNCIFFMCITFFKKLLEFENFILDYFFFTKSKHLPSGKVKK